MDSKLVGTVRVSVNFLSSSSFVWCILRQWRLMLRRELKSWPQRQQEIVTSSTWMRVREIRLSYSASQRRQRFVFVLCNTYPTVGPLILRRWLLLFSLLFRLPSPLSLVVSWAVVAFWSSCLVCLVILHTFHWFALPIYWTLSGTARNTNISEMKKRHDLRSCGTSYSISAVLTWVCVMETEQAPPLWWGTETQPLWWSEWAPVGLRNLADRLVDR